MNVSVNMGRLPAVPISGEVVVVAAAEVFGVPTRRIRNPSHLGSDAEMRARDACCWVLSMISDASEREQMRMVNRASLQNFRESVQRAVMRRETSTDYRLQTEAMLSGCLAVGRLGMGQALVGIDALDEARRMLEDPIRAVKDAPAVVLAAIIERLVDAADTLDLVRHWLVARDALGPASGDAEKAAEQSLAAAVRDALGLADEQGSDDQ